MSEIILDDLIKYHHVDPVYNSRKDEINTAIQAHPLYLNGMSFSGAWYKPDRTGTELHLELLPQWGEEEIIKAKTVYTDVFNSINIPLAI